MDRMYMYTQIYVALQADSLPSEPPVWYMYIHMYIKSPTHLFFPLCAFSN